MFQKSIIEKYLSKLDENLLHEKYEKYCANYKNETKIANIRAVKEEQYQEGFIRDVFCSVLNYTIKPEPDYNILTELKNETKQEQCPKIRRCNLRRKQRKPGACCNRAKRNRHYRLRHCSPTGIWLQISPRKLQLCYRLQFWALKTLCGNANRVYRIQSFYADFWRFLHFVPSFGTESAEKRHSP